MKPQPIQMRTREDDARAKMNAYLDEHKLFKSICVERKEDMTPGEATIAFLGYTGGK